MRLNLSAAPSLHRAGSPVVALAPLDAAMLAWLAIEGPTPRSRLIALLWPDKDADAARNVLRQRLFKLRAQVGIDVVGGAQALALADDITHDLADADDLLAQVDEAKLPAGEFARWRETQRAQRRGRMRHALVELADAAEQAKDWDDVLTHASELLALEPLSEDAHRRVMRLHYLAGDRAAALRAFDACEQVLKDEVGTRPSPETMALLATVEASESDARPVAQRVPASVVRPPRLVGRDPQWALLDQAWQTGHGAVVLGEAGMGKTRLAADFAASRGRVLMTGARPGDARVVYASLSRLLRSLPRAAIDALDEPVRRELARLLPELGQAAPIDNQAQRTRFFNAVSTALHHDALKLDGFVFDDLHFADDASIELLQYVCASSPLRWIIAARGAEVTAGGKALLEGLEARGPVVRIELAPLTLPQIEQLVASLDIPEIDAAEAAPALARRTGGNPMFLLEALKAQLVHRDTDDGHTIWPVVRSVVGLIERRIGRLSTMAVQLARCAAVAAPDFSIDLASHVLGVRTLELADPWAELEAAQVLRDGAFAHDLIYESALASVPAPVARQLHAEIATYLDQRGGEPARVAAHWLDAGRDEQALDALRRAAAKASTAMRKREAFDLLLRAADAAARIRNGVSEFDCLMDAFDAAMIADRTVLDDAFLTRLEALARAPAQRLRHLLGCSALAQSRGEFALGTQLAERAAELAHSLGEKALEVEALRGAAACANFSGNTARAVSLLRPALPWVLEHGSDSDRLGFFDDLACCLDDVDEPLESRRFHQRALDLALRMGRLDQAAVICSNVTYNLKATGRLQVAYDNALQARRYAIAFDKAHAATYTLDLMSVELLRDLARYADALRMSGVAFQSAAQNPSVVPTMHRYMACLWLHLGQNSRAQQSLQKARTSPIAPHQRSRDAQLEGRLKLSLGESAVAAFERAQADAPLAGRTFVVAMTALDHALILPPGEALAVCERTIERCEPIGYLGVVMASRIRGCLFASRMAGAQDRGAALARQALATPLDVYPDDLYRGELWRNAALAFEAAACHDEARASVRAGREWLQRTVDEHVPEEFRDGFLHRNPVNRELLALASRLLHG